MLEHAQVSATDYNHRANLPAERQLRLPPNAVKMLSKGYSNDNQRDRSVTVRLEFADLYLKNGQKKLAQQVLDAEWQRSLPVDLDANLKRRLDALTDQPGALLPTTSTKVPSRTALSSPSGTRTRR